MSRPRSFDHDAARVRLARGESPTRIARDVGVTIQAVRRLLHPQAPRAPQAPRTPRDMRRPNPHLLASLGVDGRDPVRAARAAALSARIRRLHAEARTGGALLCGPLQVAAAHAAGLTLDDIEQVFAVPSAEAVRAIAAHAGR